MAIASAKMAKPIDRENAVVTKSDMNAKMKGVPQLSFTYLLTLAENLLTIRLIMLYSVPRFVFKAGNSRFNVYRVFRIRRATNT